MKGVRRITIGRSKEVKQHQIYHGPAIRGIVDGKVNTAAVLQFGLHRLAYKVVQTTKLDCPRQFHRGIEDLEAKDQGSRNKTSSKRTMVAVLQGEGRLHVGRAVHLAKLILPGTEGRELIGHLQGMIQIVNSQKKRKIRPSTLELLCRQQEPWWVAAKLMALISRDTTLLMISSQVNMEAFRLPHMAHLLPATLRGLASQHINRLIHMVSHIHTHSSQRYSSAYMGRNQMSRNIKDGHRMADRLHRDNRRHMYNDIHMNSHRRGNALAEGRKANGILDDRSHTGNNLHLDKPLLMRRLLRMGSK